MCAQGRRERCQPLACANEPAPASQPQEGSRQASARAQVSRQLASAHSQRQDKGEQRTKTLLHCACHALRVLLALAPQPVSKRASSAARTRTRTTASRRHLQPARTGDRTSCQPVIFLPRHNPNLPHNPSKQPHSPHPSTTTSHHLILTWT